MFLKKTQVKIIKLDKKIGYAQFIIPNHLQSDVRDIDLRLSGYINKNKLNGKVQYCKTSIIEKCVKDKKHEFPKSENFILLSINHEIL